MIKTAFFTWAEWAFLYFLFGKKRESKNREERRGEKGGEEKKEVIEKRESQKQRGGGIVCINTVSSQCRVSFQAFVAAPTMKCVCPQKPYTHSGGFPDLRETERRRRRRRSRRKSAVANAHYQAGQPERRESQGTWLIHRAALTARPWHRLLSLANNAIQHHTARVMLEWESQYCALNPKDHYFSFCCVCSVFFPYKKRLCLSFCCWIKLNKLGQ